MEHLQYYCSDKFFINSATGLVQLLSVFSRVNYPGKKEKAVNSPIVQK